MKRKNLHVSQNLNNWTVFDRKKNWIAINSSSVSVFFLFFFSSFKFYCASFAIAGHFDMRLSLPRHGNWYCQTRPKSRTFKRDKRNNVAWKTEQIETVCWMCVYVVFGVAGVSHWYRNIDHSMTQLQYMRCNSFIGYNLNNFELLSEAST